MTTNRALRLFSLALCFLMLCSLLSGCGSRLSLNKRSDEAQLTSPMLKGTKQAEALNQKLMVLYDPLLKTVATLRGSGLDVVLHYELSETKNGTLLQTTLKGRGTSSDISSVAKMNAASVMLPDLFIDESGVLFGTEQWDGTVLSDPVFFKDLLLLNALHVTSSFLDYNSVATDSGIAMRAVELYESLSGKEVDLTNVLPTITDKVSAKAYAIGLFAYYEGMPNLQEAQTWPPILYSGLADYTRNVYGLLYTDLGREATVGDAFVYLDLMLPPMGLLYQKTAEELLPALAADPGRKLTRSLWATLVRQCFEKLDIETTKGDYVDHPVQDCKLADVKYALGYDLVQSYPGYSTYTPNQSVRLYQLSDLSAHFASRAYSLCNESFEDTEEQTYSYRQISRYLAGLAAYCLDCHGAKDEVKKVVNDRTYTFYYRQADTGTYSSVNCMPTVTYMCLKWQNKEFDKKPEEIRSAVDPKGTGGWTLYTAEEALKKYGGRYEEWMLDYDSQEKNIDRMIAELDKGRVLYCMIHEGDLTYDGHCMLVYGYEKSGDSTFFYADDPGFGNETNIYGKPAGEGRKLEAHYTEWITERWSYAVLSILP